MKKALIALALACAAATAHAGATVNFWSQSETCPSYCAGFVTDNPAYALNWLNATSSLATTPRTVLSVNSKSYSGYTLATLFGSAVVDGQTHYFYQVTGVLVAADGSAVTVAYSLAHWTTRVTSGRDAGHLVQHWFVGSGNVTL